MEIRFASKRDGWLVALVWAGAGLAVVGGLVQLGAGASILVRSSILLFLLGGAGFMLWALYATDYLLRRDELLVRCGPFRYRIPLAEIRSVSPSRDPRSSPATSLDRLLIRWSARDRRLLVSPEPRREFLQELAQRCPHLTLQGERLCPEGPA